MILDIIDRVGKVIYDLRPAAPLPKSRPRIAFLPRYVGVVQIPEAILGSDDPFGVIETELEALGFELHREHRHAAVFTRGHSWGDLSAHVARTEVHFGMPLGPEVSLRAEYSAFAAFDTGDLWQLATDIAARIGSKPELADPDGDGRLSAGDG